MVTHVRTSCYLHMHNDEPERRYTFVDPVSPRFNEAMRRLRFDPEHATNADRYTVMSAAEAYVHLATHCGTEGVIRQLREIRRFVQEGAKR